MNDATPNDTFFKSIFEASVEGILVVDVNGIIKLANAASEGLFGYGQGQLLGILIDTLFPKKFGKTYRGDERPNKSKSGKPKLDKEMDVLGRYRDGKEFRIDITTTFNNFMGESVMVVFVKDATGRNSDVALLEKSNAVLVEVNRKYSTLIGNLRGIVYRCQNDGNWAMEYISAGCERITGYTQQEFLAGKVHFSQIILKEDREGVRKETQQAILEKNPYSLAFRIRDKNGTIKYMQELGQGIFDKDGNLEALEGFITDISPQKETELELLANEAKNKALLEAIPDMMFILDYEGTYLDYFTPVAHKLWMSPEDFIGKNVRDVLPPDVFLTVKRTMDKAVLGKKLEVVEYSQNTKNVEQFYEARIVPLNQHGLLIVVRDITEAKQAVTTLKKEKKRLQQYLETAASLFVVIDTDHRVLLINKKATEVLGYQTDEIIGMNWFELAIPKSERKEMAAMFDNILQGKIPFKDYFENHILTKDKQNRLIQWRNSIITDQTGKPTASLSSGIDITEQSWAEKELLESHAKNAALLQAIPDTILSLDAKGNYLDVYTQEPDRWLLPKEDIIGGNMKDWLSPTNFDKIKMAIDSAIAHKETHIVEYEMERINGMRQYETRVVYLNENKVLAIARDITQRKITEQELRESEARNKAVFEALPDLLFMIDEKGTYIDVHSPDPSLLMAPKETLIGTKMADYLPKQLCENVMDAFQKSKETGMPQILEFQIPINKNPRYFESRIVSVNDNRFLMLSRDIHERKRVENILFARNRALASAGNGILITDAKLPDRPIIYANKAFYDMTGYGSGEVLGKNCRFLQNDDRDQEVIITMAKTIQKGEPCQVTLRNYKKDGTLFWNELTITPVHNDEGELTHFIGVQNDVTDRKNGETLKDHIRKTLEMMAQQKPLKSIGKEIVKASESNIEGGLAFILKLDSKKKTLHQLVAPGLPKRFIGAVDGMRIGLDKGPCASAAFHKKAVVVADLEKDGRWKGFIALALKDGLRACWSYPILSSDKQVLGLFTIYHKTEKTPTRAQKEIIADLVQLTSVALEQDRIGEELKKSRWLLEDYAKELEQKVTERTNELKSTVRQLVETNMKLKDQVLDTMAAENKALESQAMFTAISKNFPKGIITVFNTDYEIVYIDGGEIQRLGFDKGQLEGLCINDIDILSQKRIDRIKTDIKKTLEGQQLSFEMKFRNKTYAVNTSPLAAGNIEVQWALFVYNDVSKQKQAEDDIRSALVREQELNVLKSRFISMASHEFRTPLSAISTSAILIGKQHAPDKVQRREKYVEQIQKNVRNLVTILNDFLSLGRLEEGKVRPKPEAFDFVEFTNHLVNDMEPNRKRGQNIKVSADQESIEVYLDTKMMQHILTNLLSNAIKYSGEGEEISVSLKNSNKIVRLQVSDQGIGIPKEEQANLFERFFRAENSTNIEGTGLGLHIVKQYTELMGGQVGFKSEEGRGATFWVEFEVP